MMNKNLLLITVVLIFSRAQAQEARLTDRNTIGWFAYTGTFKIKPKLAIHTEFQWRRTGAGKNAQQDLYRTGIIYTPGKAVSLVAGYAYAHTYAYGDYPAAFAFPEHRIFQQALIKNPIGPVDLSHRFMLEQRFVGRVTGANGIKNTSYLFTNRMRYRVRGEIYLHKKEATKKNWSFIAQDEIFIGWGKNMGANIFDQNRLGLLLGYKINNRVKLEGGYFNQTLQQARRVNDKAVFQYNSGFLLACNLTVDLINK